VAFSFSDSTITSFCKGIIMSSTTITRGNVRETFYIQPVLAPAAVASYTSAVQTFTVPGLLTTDIVKTIGAVAVQTAGILPGESDCYTNNILSIQFLNVTNASATPAQGAYNIEVTRLEGPAPVTAV
jgi:hypothetical protein